MTMGRPTHAHPLSGVYLISYSLNPAHPISVEEKITCGVLIVNGESVLTLTDGTVGGIPSIIYHGSLFVKTFPTLSTASTLNVPLELIETVQSTRIVEVCVQTKLDVLASPDSILGTETLIACIPANPVTTIVVVVIGVAATWTGALIAMLHLLIVNVLEATVPE
jgi:hypothetical protein